jgi:hypothetical protein
VEEEGEAAVRENKSLSAAQVELDQLRLRLYHQLSDADKADRALDLISDLLLRKSLPVAVKVAQTTSQIPLAQRVNTLLVRTLVFLFHAFPARWETLIISLAAIRNRLG